MTLEYLKELLIELEKYSYENQQDAEENANLALLKYIEDPFVIAKYKKILRFDGEFYWEKPKILEHKEFWENDIR